MSGNDFCSDLRSELSAWRDTVDEVLKRFENIRGPKKAKILGNIEDLHMVVEELNERIEQLKETCSINGFEDIATERENYRQANPSVRDIDQAMAAISAGTFGG